MLSRIWRGAVARCVAALIPVLATCSPTFDQRQMDSADQLATSYPVVRVAFGWRAREVERQSTARVAFSDQDVGAIIVENDPAALAYAEPQHAFTLPPGRFVRVDQAAGRVYDATTTPHLEALTPDAAVTLADSVAHLLERAGWVHVPNEGRGAAAAVAAAVRYASDGQGGVGVSHVGTWRVPRPAAAWAAHLPDPYPSRGIWDGVEAVVTTRPVRSALGGGPPKLIFEVKLTDQVLSSVLFAMSEARRARHAGEMQTLRSWDMQPTEPIQAAR